MTYAGFLFWFLVLPILGLLLLLRRRVRRRWAFGTLAVMVLALLYTGPWDHLIISQGVWSYPPGRIIGPTVGLVPLEEFAFMVLQVLLTGLVVLALARPPIAAGRPASDERG